jgi:glucose/arabinose dehydrogenase
MPTARLLLVVLLAVALLPAAPRPADAATRLPDGFRLESVESGHGPFQLAAFVFVPGGGMLTLGRAGALKFVPEGEPARTIGQVPGVHVLQDVGAIGLVLSPDFATSGHLYLAYTYLDPAGRMTARVSRWTVAHPATPTAIGQETMVLDGIRQDVAVHGLGTLAFAPDGALLVGMGDAADYKGADPRRLRAQVLNEPYGKILRIDPATGAGRPDNPFFDPAAPSSWRSRTYALGLRNPFRFALDPATGRMLAGDVGWNSFEEINRILPGGNYGWPCYEGPNRVTAHASSPVCVALAAKPQSVVPPLVSQPHAGAQASITGGVWYTGDSYPQRYRNAYFYGDYARQMLWTLRLGDQGTLGTAPEAAGFASGVGGMVDIRSGPNGDIHLADILTGRVQRLRYAPGNRAPSPVIDTVVDAETLTVTFDGSRSSDLDGDQLSYAWDLGDGTALTGRAPPPHRYPAAGTYTARLTVTDAVGATASTSVQVVPQNHAPQLVLDAGPPRTYAVGQPVELSATATDLEDGPLEVRWQPLLLHCPGTAGCHAHPEDTRSGPTFVEPFADHGDATHLRVLVSAVDSAGVAAQQVYDAQPDLRTLTVLSPVPAVVNGREQVSTQVAVGSTNVVALPVSSGPYTFVSRSDGGGPEQELTMPASDVTITAVYDTAIAVRRRSMGPGSFLGSPTGPELDAGPGRVQSYAGGDIYWSSGTGAYWVAGGIRTRYGATGGRARFGFPTTDELVAPVGGRESRFQNATFYWTRATGARFVAGAIRTAYVRHGASAGVLRFPVTDEARIAGGAMSRFQAGDIYWSRPTGAHMILTGAIRTRWLALGGHRGRLGYPRTDQVRKPYGWVVRFQGGTIAWVRATRTAKVTYT